MDVEKTLAELKAKREALAPLRASAALGDAAAPSGDYVQTNRAKLLRANAAATGQAHTR
jgi:hypothetical protein